MKFSLSSFVYFNYPLDEAIRRMARLGYDGIDVWGGRPHAYRQDLSEKDLYTIRHLLEDEGLQVASFIPAQFRYPTSLCSPNDTIRRDSIRYICDSLVTAAGLGAPVVSVCPGHSLYGQDKEDAFERLAESLWEICSAASRLQLRVAIEPADVYETDLLATCTETASFVRKLNLDNLGVLLDNGHAFIVGEDATEAVRSLGSNLFHVHIDDNQGMRDQHLIPGEGRFDFGPFMQALYESGYEGVLSAELGWDYTLNPDTAAESTLRQMKSMWGALSSI